MQLLAKEGLMLYFVTTIAIVGVSCRFIPQCAFVQFGAGAGLSIDLSQSRPADILVQGWDLTTKVKCFACNSRCSMMQRVWNWGGCVHLSSYAVMGQLSFDRPRATISSNYNLCLKSVDLSHNTTVNV